MFLTLSRCRYYQNPGYMKENFVICIESLHVPDTGKQDNVSGTGAKITFYPALRWPAAVLCVPFEGLFSLCSVLFILLEL